MGDSGTKAEMQRPAESDRSRSRRVLVLAPFGQDAPIISRQLRTAGFETRICTGVGDLCREMQGQASQAVVP